MNQYDNYQTYHDEREYWDAVQEYEMEQRREEEDDYLAYLHFYGPEYLEMTNTLSEARI